jgi:SAM-dependent methyltransferase
MQILTPTGARPEAWALCMRWMARQTYAGPVHWVIVDDGQRPQELPKPRDGWTITLCRPKPYWTPGRNTQYRNLRAGMAHIVNTRGLVIVEDDDHYAPEWLERVAAELQTADMVGQRLCRKYSLTARRGRELVHPFRASLCATGLKGAGIVRLRNTLMGRSLLIDNVLWKPGVGKLFDGAYVTGIKCLPGRAGIDSGHRPNFGELADPDGALLRRWLGDEDARAYEPMIKTTTRDAEIAIYSKCYQSKAYAMGARRRASVQAMIASLAPGSLLDIGCGRGESLGFAQAAGHTRVMGTEVVPGLLNKNVVYAEAHQLPFFSGEFDHVTCWDVLEHLTEADIRPALVEMMRVASRTVTVSASERSDIREGRELHISRRPKTEWLRIIRECWGPAAQCIGAAGASPMFQVMKS